jgi:hypothetical protein
VEAAGIEPVFENDITSVFANPKLPHDELAAVCQRKVDLISLQLASNDTSQIHSSLIAILWRMADDETKRHVVEQLKRCVLPYGDA